MYLAQCQRCGVTGLVLAGRFVDDEHFFVPSMFTEAQKPTREMCWDGGDHEMVGLSTRRDGEDIVLNESCCAKCGTIFWSIGKLSIPTMFDEIGKDKQKRYARMRHRRY